MEENMFFICQIMNDKFIKENGFVLIRDDEKEKITCYAEIKGTNTRIKCYINVFDKETQFVELVIYTSPQLSEETERLIGKDAAKATGHRVYFIVTDNTHLYVSLFEKNEAEQTIHVLKTLTESILDTNVFYQIL